MSKKLLLFFAGIVIVFHLRGQSSPPLSFDATAPGITIRQVIDNLHSQLGSNDTGEGGKLQLVSGFDAFWGSRAAYNDSSGENMFQQYYKSLQLDQVAKQTSGCTTAPFMGAWESIGPDESSLQKLGRAEAVWVSPTDTSYILLATFGGLFKTVDAGANWHCITDNTSFITGLLCPISIAVNPNNQNQIYLGTGLTGGASPHTTGLEFGATTLSKPYGGGIIYSTDGGQTWQQEIIQQGSSADWYDNIEQVQNVIFSPDGNKLFALVDNQIFYKNYPSGSWTKIFSASSTDKYDWNNICFIPGSNTDFFASSTNNDPYSYNYTALKRFTYSTGNYSYVDVSLPDPGTTGSQTVLVSPKTNSSMYVVIRDYVSTLDAALYLYTYDPSNSAGSSSFSLINAALPDDVPQGTYAVSLNSSIDNPDIVYYSTEYPYVSLNGGTSFLNRLSEYGGNPTHCDIRGTYLHHSEVSSANPGTLDRIYYANDGGISIKPRGKDPYVYAYGTTENINGKGLAIGHQMGIGLNEDGEEMVLGAWHNGFQSYEPTFSPPWYFMVQGSDGGDAVYNRKFKDKAYIQDHDYDLYVTHNSTTISPRVLDAAHYVNNFPGTTDEPRTYQFPKWAHEDGSIFTGLTDMYMIPPTSGNVTFIQQASGQGVQTGNPDINLRNDNSIPKIRCMDFSQYVDDHLTGYVIYEDGGFYYRPESGPFATSFTAKTTLLSELQGRPATDVALDPHHPERVWVSIGGLNWASDARDRVVYSPDGGDHWFDISKGLPQRIPVTQIVYHNGMNTLYASTDIGIYKLDMNPFAYSNINDDNSGYNSVQWTCFSKGITGGPDYPYSYTTDMQINYCQGKLYTTTYGRATWSTDLLAGTNNSLSIAIGDDTPSAEEEVTTTTTWSSDKYIQTGIHVTNNATLTISGSTTVIHMPKNGKIVIEPGAKLVVDGATLTHDCQGFWFGIEALGDPNQAQTPTYQATVELKNGATIEHARFGISNWNHNTLHTGAIITASNTHFHNNHKSVELESYHHVNTNTYQYIPYAASFKQCDFVIDDDFRGDALNYLFDTHISMWDVEGVRISGCVFQNNNTGASKGHGYGILSYNAGYKTSTYPTSFYRTQFQGFKAGILAEGDAFNNQPTIDITKTDFDACTIGIWAKNVHNFSSTECTYDIGYGTIYGQECLHNIGIYSVNCHQFTIENNTFTGVGTPPSNWKNVGSYTENSGSNDKEIAQNTFSNLHIACLAQGNNSELYTNLPMVQQSGLRYSCNTYSYNQKDIVVQVENSNQGIAKIQGSLLNGAGNTFTPSGYFYNEGHPIRYFNSGGYTLPTYMSSNITPLTAPTRNCGNGLPDATDHPPLAPARKTELIAMLYDNIAIRANKQATYDSLMDGGSLDTLMDYLVGESSFSALDVKDYIMSLSPFVSDSVLSYLISSNLLPESALLEVLAANPEALQDPDLLDKLLTETELELTQQDLAYLDYLAFSSTAKTAHEVDIADASYQVGYALNKLLADAKEDTTAIATDSMISWLLAVKEPWADYDAAGIMLRHGDIENATTVLEAMPDLYAFGEDENSDYEAFLSLKSLIGDMWDEGRSTNQLDSADIATLETIAGGHRGQNSGAIAEAILEANAEEPHQYCAPIYTTYTLSRRYKPQPVPKMHAEGIKVYPNPADRYVIFTYNFPLAKNSLSVRIADVTGKLVQTLPLNGNNGQTIWDTRNTPSGNYVYGVYDGSTAISTGKIVLQRQ